MSEMVERVARAICEKNCENPDEPSYAFLTDKVTGHAWEGYIPHARAVIEAMREPTFLMTTKAYKAPIEQLALGPHLGHDGAKTLWQAMIDEALK